MSSLANRTLLLAAIIIIVVVVSPTSIGAFTWSSGADNNHQRKNNRRRHIFWENAPTISSSIQSTFQPTNMGPQQTSPHDLDDVVTILHNTTSNSNGSMILGDDDDDVVAVSVSVDNDTGVSSRSHNSPPLPPAERVTLAIIGAGAAGLQCASSFLQAQRVNTDDEDDTDNGSVSLSTSRSSSTLMILEARNRVGGRIYTTYEQQPILVKQEEEEEIGTTTKEQSQQVVEIPLDHGATWVHGTKGNPMVALLKKQSTMTMTTTTTTTTTSNDNTLQNNNNNNRADDENEQLPFLEKVFTKGNPWMRPNTVLHETGELCLFLNGQQISSKKTMNNAMKCHYKLLQQLEEYANQLFSSGEGMETVFQTWEQSRNKLQQQDQQNYYCSSTTNEEKDDVVGDDDTIMTNEDLKQVTLFYSHLLECWHGSSASQLQMGSITVDPTDAIVTTNSTTATTTTIGGTEDDDEEDDDDDVHDEEATEESYKNAGDYQGPHCTVKKGMTTVLQPLLEDIGSERIRLQEPVVRIEDLGDTHGVQLETASGLKVVSDCCVVTLPMGCLKEIVLNQQKQQQPYDFFTPSLSLEKIEAIQALSIASYRKVFLTFDYIFWPTEESFLGLIRRDHGGGGSSNKDHDDEDKDIGQYLLINNLWAKKGIPSFEATLIGNASQWANHQKDETIRNVVLTFIHDAMGLKDTTIQELQSHCVSCQVTRWEEDPYSRGAYCNFGVGTMERHIDALNEPEWDGRLIFAGEAMNSEYLGSVHAALTSGQLASKQVQQYLSSSSSSSSSSCDPTIAATATASTKTASSIAI